MIKHIVSFKLKGSEAQRLELSRQFKAALEALPAQIEVLQSIEVETWDIVLTAIVATMDDVAVYAKHPAHVAAAAIIAEHKECRACVDYSF